MFNLKELEKDSTLVSKLGKKNLIKLIKKADKHYHKFKKPVMSDDLYDSLKYRLSIIDSEHPLLNITQSSGKNEVKLPFRMPGLDKVSDTKGVNKFIKKCDIFILEDKHDGLSIALTNENKKWNLYSRGTNGVKGQNLNHLTKYINLPKVPKDKVEIRAEIQLKECIFKKYFKGKNSRTTLAGYFTRKENFKKLKYTDVLAYQLIKNGVILKPERQLVLLQQKYGFQVPNYRVVNCNKVNYDKLKKYFLIRKKESLYNIDGIVLICNEKYSIPSKNNPKYSVKFKINFDFKTTTVKKVKWQESSNSKLNPVLILKPVKINGVTISKVTGFNFKFIKDNGIGKGAVVRISRSGDVIPDLRAEDVIKSVKPDLPKNYKLSETGVYAYSIKENSTIKIKKIDKFFRSIGVEEFSVARIRRFYKAGYNTIFKILDMSKLDMANIKGFNTKSSNIIYNNIHTKNKICITRLMYGSSIFGDKFGLTRLEVIAEKFNTKLKNREEITIDEIVSLHGFEKKLASSFPSNLFKFYKVLSKLEKYYSITIPKSRNHKGILNNITIVFTGFRDKGFEKFVKVNGGKTLNSISKNVNLLVIPDKDYENKKTESAVSLKIPIITRDKFHTYCINNF